MFIKHRKPAVYRCFVLNDPSRDVINIFHPFVHISPSLFRFSSKIPRNSAIIGGFFHLFVEKKTYIFVTFPEK
jgi:hypothetical protein